MANPRKIHGWIVPVVTASMLIAPWTILQAKDFDGGPAVTVAARQEADEEPADDLVELQDAWWLQESHDACSTAMREAYSMIRMKVYGKAIAGLNDVIEECKEDVLGADIVQLLNRCRTMVREEDLRRKRASMIWVMRSDVEVRGGPSNDFPVIAKVGMEDRLPLCDEFGEWFKVWLPEGEKGWLRRSEASAYQPRGYEEHIAIGFEFLRNGEARRALFEFQRVQPFEPNNSMVRSGLGIAYADIALEFGTYRDKATEELNMAVILEPRNSRNHFLRGALKLALSYSTLLGEDEDRERCRKSGWADIHYGASLPDAGETLKACMERVRAACHPALRGPGGVKVSLPPNAQVIFMTAVRCTDLFAHGEEPASEPAEEPAQQ